MAVSATGVALGSPAPATPAGRKGARAGRSGRSREGAIFPHRLLPYLLIGPQLAVTVAFFLWPTVRAIRESLVQNNAFGIGGRFSGMANFVDAIANGSYLRSIEVTFAFAGLTTVAAMAVGLFLAVEVDQAGRVRTLYRTLFICTYAIPGAIAGTLWLFLFEPYIGPGARLLTNLGVNWNFALHGPQAFGLIVALTVWQQSAYNFLFFTAGLQAIPSEMTDAAAVDGASRLSRFWRIVFPLLSPTTFFLLVMNVLYAFFSSFAIVDILTQGGPGGATTTLVYRLYRDGFLNSDTGIAGAETVVLLVIAGGLTALQFRFLNKRVHYR